MKKITLISLLFVLLTGCSSTKQFRYMSKGKAPKGTFRTEIPFEIHSKLMVIKVKLGGSDKEYEFMIDTGAPVSVIYKDVFEAAKADTVMVYNVSDSRGNSAKSVYVMLDMTIGNSKFKDIFTVYAAEPSEIVQCIALDGIIGADLMQTANWEIDMENQKIIITDFKSGRPNLQGYQKVSGAKRSPSMRMPWLTVVPGLTVDLEIKGKKFKDVYVDTGSAGSLTMPKDEKTDSVFKKEQKTVLWGYSSFGLLGGSMDTTYAYNTVDVEMGKVHIPNPSIDMYKRNSSLLGMGILSDYNLFFDFRKNDMYLKPIAAEKKKNDEKGFGFYIHYDSKSKVFTVANLYEGSGAAKAGLQLADTVVEVNNEKLPVFTDFCEFREWTKALGKTEGSMIIKIKRDDLVFTIEKGIMPKRL
jgi:predicted aspartyl protease